MNIDNNTIMVIGGSGGIGLAIVKRMIENNYRVIATYNKSKTKLDELKEHYSFSSSTLQTLQLDLLFPKKINFKILPKCNSIIFSAGIPSFSKLSECAKDELYNQLNIHALTPLFIIQNYLQLYKTGLKNIIFISSTAGIELKSHNGTYAFSKACTNLISVLLAKELRCKGIKVNTIASGWCETNMANTVLKRQMKKIEDLRAQKITKKIVTPVEIAELCLTIISDKLPHLQGQIIVLNSLDNPK